MRNSGDILDRLAIIQREWITSIVLFINGIADGEREYKCIGIVG